eukprot:g5087.t1
MATSMPFNELQKSHAAVEEPAAHELYLSESSDDSDDYEEDEFDEESKVQIKSRARKGRRGTVMAAPIEIDTSCEFPVFLKRSSDIRSLSKAINENFLFQLDKDDLDTILDAFEPQEVGAGATVIMQGDTDARFFYVIGDGECDIYVDGSKVVTLGKGNSFGELALLYDAPRAATVKVPTSRSAKLWRLDRDTFKRILVSTHERELAKRVTFLKKVPILSQLEELQTKLLAEAMKTCNFASGRTIIKEGEEGGTFYLVVEGQVKFVVGNTGQIGGQEVGKRGEAGSYFGEIALISNEKRQATVIATKDTKCLSIDRKRFKHLLGPLTSYLKKNMELYKKVVR